MSSLDRNYDYVPSAYKLYDSPLSIGSWIALLATFKYSNNKIETKSVEELSSGTRYKPSPLVIRLDTKTSYEDFRLIINYDIAVFDGYVNGVEKHVEIKNQTTEILIPKNTRENSLIDSDIRNIIRINNIEVLDGLNADVEISFLALASNNSILYRLINFDRNENKLFHMMMGRFVNKMPCWMCEGTKTFKGSTCPNCNGSGEDISYFSGNLADDIALDLGLFRKTLSEPDETLRQRAWGHRRWVIPRSMRNIDSNIHSVCARYMDVDESEIHIYEKPQNFYSIDPEASWRPRTRGWDFFDDWSHDGTESYGTYLRYLEIIENKNFENRLIVSSNRALNSGWINCFTNDGRFDNTVKMDYGYSYEIVANQGYAGFFQSVDFTQMDNVKLAYKIQSNPHLPNVPPGFHKGRWFVLVSDKTIKAFESDESFGNLSLNAEYESLISGSNVLVSGTVNYGDYPSPESIVVDIDTSAIAGKHFLYFIVQSYWDELYFTVEVLTNDYGDAVSRSPVYDMEQRTDMERIFTYVSYIGDKSKVYWRYRANKEKGKLFTSAWSSWYDKSITDLSSVDDVRYVQFEIKFTSSDISSSSPVLLDQFDFMAQHTEYVGIILDPTVAVSMPVLNTGKNAWWTYSNGDQGRFKELVDSMITGCVTPRTEFYIDVEDEL